MMSIKPILMNADMVQAILEGRKTVTRRVVKPQPENDAELLTDNLLPETGEQGLGKVYCFSDATVTSPPYQPGDILYVRETWGISNLDYDNNVAYIAYKASENEENEGCREVKLPNDKFEKLYDSMAENSPDWRPSIHMPKEASRIFLRVTDVQLEPLRDITDDGALHEGAKGVKCDHYTLGEHGCTDCMNTGWIEPPIVEFMYIWDSIIKKSDIDRYGWDANPWVWVIEFERCEKPEGWCSND